VRTCATCGEELPALARSNRRYCDAACRRRAHERRRRPPVETELAPVLPITDDARLAEAVERATAEVRLVGLVAAEARHNWRAAAWILERSHPERWGPVRRRPDGELEVVDDPMFAEVDELRRRRERQPRK
jgi:hypothetical protein